MQLYTKTYIPVDLPLKYSEKLSTLLTDLQKETGNKYTLVLNQFNRELQIIYGNFDGKIQVYDMEEKYKEVEGVYENRAEFDDKITSLTAKDYYTEQKSVEYQGKPVTIGKCKNCGSYNEKTLMIHGLPYTPTPNLISSKPQCCRNVTGSIWEGMRCSENSDKVWSQGGYLYGDVYQLITRGRYKFV